ncbi:MAG: low molecular weight phosphotyrosine protein phosphatase [Leptospiraceae bacterium]|nr:low molecular weight phosphotyrosine protein phosphatase [Leptospiraceae bacterium]
MKKKVLFVCLGNICRSPAAEGAFRHIVKSKKLDHLFEIDSCGTAGYHIGELPHSTTRQVALKRGIRLEHRCRKFETADFEKFDFIMVMDDSNHKDVLSKATNASHMNKVMKFRKFDKFVNGSPDVPDPYYGGLDGFEEVQDIVIRSSEGLLEWILKESQEFSSK